MANYLADEDKVRRMVLVLRTLTDEQLEDDKMRVDMYHRYGFTTDDAIEWDKEVKRVEILRRKTMRAH